MQFEAVALGGRAAEELFVGKISTGASDDLDKVTATREGWFLQSGGDQWAFYGCILWSGQNWYIFQVRRMIFFLENT